MKFVWRNSCNGIELRRWGRLSWLLVLRAGTMQLSCFNPFDTLIARKLKR
jgi:hypothetical protein